MSKLIILKNLIGDFCFRLKFKPVKLYYFSIKKKDQKNEKKMKKIIIFVLFLFTGILSITYAWSQWFVVTNLNKVVQQTIKSSKNELKIIKIKHFDLINYLKTFKNLSFYENLISYQEIQYKDKILKIHTVIKLNPYSNHLRFEVLKNKEDKASLVFQVFFKFDDLKTIKADLIFSDINQKEESNKEVFVYEVKRPKVSFSIPMENLKNQELLDFIKKNDISVGAESAKIQKNGNSFFDIKDLKMGIKWDFLKKEKSVNLYTFSNEFNVNDLDSNFLDNFNIKNYKNELTIETEISEKIYDRWLENQKSSTKIPFSHFLGMEILSAFFKKNKITIESSGLNKNEEMILKFTIVTNPEKRLYQASGKLELPDDIFKFFLEDITLEIFKKVFKKEFIVNEKIPEEEWSDADAEAYFKRSLQLNDEANEDFSRKFLKYYKKELIDETVDFFIKDKMLIKKGNSVSSDFLFHIADKEKGYLVNSEQYSGDFLETFNSFLLNQFLTKDRLIFDKIVMDLREKYKDLDLMEYHFGALEFRKDLFEKLTLNGDPYKLNLDIRNTVKNYSLMEGISRDRIISSGLISKIASHLPAWRNLSKVEKVELLLHTESEFPHKLSTYQIKKFEIDNIPIPIDPLKWLTLPELLSFLEGKPSTESEAAFIRKKIPQVVLIDKENDLKRQEDAGKAFLENFVNKEGATKTASGLAYKVMKEGTGATPSSEDIVEVHYHNTLIDGTVYDSSIERGETISFPANRVIKGWTEGLQTMKEGGISKFVIPSDLAYGKAGAPPKIPGGATTITKIRLIKVKKKEKK